MYHGVSSCFLVEWYPLFRWFAILMCTCIDGYRFLLFSQRTQPRQDHVPENFNAAARELEVTLWWDYLAWDDWIRIYFHVPHVPHLEIFITCTLSLLKELCVAPGSGSCGPCLDCEPQAEVAVDLMHSMQSLIHAMAVWNVKISRWGQ